MNSAVIKQALRILRWQAVAWVVMVGVAGFWQGPKIALAVGVGVLIGMVTTAYLVFVLIKHTLQPARPATVLSLFGNWLVKVLLTVGLLALALRSQLAPGAVLAGLAGSLVVYWLAMLAKQNVLRSQQVRQTN